MDQCWNGREIDEVSGKTKPLAAAFQQVGSGGGLDRGIKSRLELAAGVVLPRKGRNDAKVMQMISGKTWVERSNLHFRSQGSLDGASRRAFLLALCLRLARCHPAAQMSIWRGIAWPDVMKIVRKMHIWCGYLGSKPGLGFQHVKGAKKSCNSPRFRQLTWISPRSLMRIRWPNSQCLSWRANAWGRLWRLTKGPTAIHCSNCAISCAFLDWPNRSPTWARINHPSALLLFRWLAVSFVFLRQNRFHPLLT